jgi:hypothetical protein
MLRDRAGSRAVRPRAAMWVRPWRRRVRWRIPNCDENVHCTWLDGDVFWPPQDSSSAVTSGCVILVDIFKGRRWPRTGRLVRMTHGKGIIGTANGAPPGSSQGSQSGAATGLGRRPGCEWARPPSATGHPLSLMWASPSPAAEDLTRKGANAHLVGSGSGVSSLSES